MDQLTPRVPPEVAQQVAQFDQALTALESSLQALAATPMTDVDALPPLARARMHVATARALHALHQMYLRVHGENPLESKTIKQDGLRILDRARRVEEAEAAAANGDQGAHGGAHAGAQGGASRSKSGDKGRERVGIHVDIDINNDTSMDDENKQRTRWSGKGDGKRAAASPPSASSPRKKKNPKKRKKG